MCRQDKQLLQKSGRSFCHLMLISTLEKVKFEIEVSGLDHYHEWLSQLNELTLVKKISFEDE